MSGKGRAGKVLAVDWDSRTLRLVYAHVTKRGVKIDRLLSVVIPAGVDTADPRQMGGHIRKTLDQEGIATRHAIVDVPRDQAILTTLMLPTKRPDELPGMVEIQIAKELPFPTSEAVIDFAVAPGEDEAATGEVLVSAIRRELLEQYEATFGAAGLKLDRVGLRPYASKVSLCRLLKHAIPERVLFIDVRPTFMEIDVLKRSALVFSRSASVSIPQALGESKVLSIARAPATPGTEDEPDSGSSQAPVGLDSVVHSLVLEVTRSIEAYRANDHGATIDHVVIGGDVGVEEALAEAIQKRLNITTEMYNPASIFGWEPDEGADACAFAASLGLVLSDAEDGLACFDFLHPKKMVSATKERLKKAPIVAAIVTLFVLAGSVGLAAVTRDDRQKLARLEAGISKLRGNRSANKKFLDLMSRIRGFDAQQHVWVDVLHDVCTLLPSNQEMLIGHLDMNQKEGRLKLKTRYKRWETVTELIRRLKEFRREGREEPRFEVQMGTETEKKGEKYAFSQELWILIRDDGPPKEGASKRTFGG